MGNLSAAVALGEGSSDCVRARSDQRRDALRRANQVRLVRAELKRRLSAGSLFVVDVVSDPPVELLAARVVDVLCAAPGLGPVKARAVLSRHDMSPAVRFADLSPARRKALAETLEHRGHRCLHESAHKPIVAKAGTKR